jgi:O-antigen/teichoic acid export membrane protein
VAVFGSDLHVIFGDGFTVSPVVAFFLALGYFVGGVLAPLGYALSMTGRHRIESGVIVAGGVALVAATAVGARFWGAEGAAAASCAVLLAVNLVRAGLVRKLKGFFVPSLWGTAAAVPALLLAWGARLVAGLTGAPPFVQFALGTTAYTLLFGLCFVLYLQRSSGLVWLKPRRAA